MRFSLLIVSAATALAAAAGTPAGDFRLPENFDPWNANFHYPLELLQQASNAMGGTSATVKAPARENGLRQIRKEPELKRTLLAVGQTFHKNYVFNYNGGAITTYDIEVALDGDEVTISNLFNLEAQSTEYSKGVDYDIKGKYDAEAKTITIPTLSNFEDATIAGTIGDSYTELLMSGTVNESGQLAPDDELVFHVVGDFEGLTTDQNIGIMHYFTSLGMSFGMQTIYRSFNAYLPTDEPRLIGFNTRFDMGEAFIGTESSVEASYVNLSSASVDYAITMEADGNAFSASPAAGMAEPGSMFEVTYTFAPTEKGEYEGIASLEYEGVSETPQPLVTLFTGTALEYPDYSAVVKEGDMTFTTNIEYPFEITTDADGNTVARSTVNGRSGSSKLTVFFEVPEGETGTFSWKGNSANTGYYYQNAAGYFIDEAPSAAMSWTDANADISGELQFAPGKHSVRFQYDCIYYTGDEKNGMSVHDLSFVSAKAPAAAAEVTTPEVNLGSYMIKPESPTATASGTIRLRNKGTDRLSVTEVISDNDKVTGTVPANTAALLEYLDVPVTLSTDEAGDINATLTIRTTAGDLTAKVVALVREMADFTPLVVEGADLVTAITTNESSPFEMKDGVAYNANSGMPDTSFSDSWVRVAFTVPEGKAARLEWDGHHYGGVNPEAEYAWQGADYSMFEFSHPLISGTMNVYDYDTDASSDIVASDDSWKDQLVCVPGNHYIAFHYVKNNDGYISEEDRLEISNLRIILEDFSEYGVQPNVSEVTFAPTYVGPNRYTTAVIKLRNTGSQILKVLDARTGSEPFYGTFIEGSQCSWNQEIEVGIWFYPDTEGEYEGDVTFETTAGDVTIHCIGKTNPADGILLIGDIEDAAQGWMAYDADKDGSCWNLGTNLWGERPEWVHSGSQCFASPSQGTSGEALSPDNWLISPEFIMPENGKAMLSWYIAAHHSTRYAEHYSVYCATTEQADNSENLATLAPLFSETLKEGDGAEFRQVNAELTGTPGEKYKLLFRHHDCSGEYVLKLDDVFVYTMDKWNELSAVRDIFTTGGVISSEIYDVNGIRLNAPAKGVNIVTDIYSDGHRVTRKVIVR